MKMAFKRSMAMTSQKRAALLKPMIMRLTPRKRTLHITDLGAFTSQCGPPTPPYAAKVILWNVELHERSSLLRS
jgi:hypothetical protein